MPVVVQFLFGRRRLTLHYVTLCLCMFYRRRFTMIYERDLIKYFNLTDLVFISVKCRSPIISGKVKTMNISDEEIRRFAEDGAVVLRNVFSQHWVETVKAGIEVSTWVRGSEVRALRCRSTWPSPANIPRSWHCRPARATTSMTTATGNTLLSSRTSSSTPRRPSWPAGSWSRTTPSSTTSTSSTRNQVRSDQ